MKKFGFGLMRLTLNDENDLGSVSIKELEKMVDTFMERGYTYFDTAYLYHQGVSERMVKEAIVKRYPRESFTITTKLPTIILKSKEDNERIFNEQLEKCGVEYFDYYLLHNLGVNHYKVAERCESFDFIKKLKEDGKAKKIGFSFHDDAQLLDEILTKYPFFDVVQLQLNYIDWENEGIQSRKCYEVARKHGKPIIAMEPLKGGALVQIPEEAEQIFKDFSPNLSVASWGIRYVASLPGVMMVLSGMSNEEQMLDNLSFMDDFEPLTSAEYKTIENVVEIIKNSIAIPCTACQYCVDDCPQNIAIPKYFALFNNEGQSKKGNFPLQQQYYYNLVQDFGKASDCIECKKCEKQCPQQIKIVEHLKEVADLFEVKK